MTLENFIYESVSEILNGGYEEVKKDIEKHKEIYKDDTAICFSLLALGAFLNKDNQSFYQFMNDAAFLVALFYFTLKRSTFQEIGGRSKLVWVFSVSI